MTEVTLTVVLEGGSSHSVNSIVGGSREVVILVGDSYYSVSCIIGSK